MTDVHAEAVETFLAANGLPASEIDVIGFHGQTVLHRPERRLTVQLGDGDGARGAARDPGGLRLPRRRRRGRRAGRAAGAGLPPRAGRDARSRRSRSRCSISAASPTSPLSTATTSSIACDTGPGNALIDDFMRARTGTARDDDGRAAAAGHGRRGGGRARAGSIRSSRGGRRNRSTAMPSGPGWRRRRALADKSTEDGAATLTAITAATIARVVPVLPRPPAGWIVAGGGARNPTLMRMLAERGSRRSPSRPPTPSAGRRMRSRRRPSPIWRCAVCAACRSVSRPRPACRSR